MRPTPWLKAELGRIKDLMGGPYGAPYGAFRLTAPTGLTLTIIASSDGDWEHVSVSTPNRCPTWEEMQFVKETFWGDNEEVMQVHPKKENYVNVHPYCLHLWRPTAAEIPMPPKWMIA